MKWMELAKLKEVTSTLENKAEKMLTSEQFRDGSKLRFRDALYDILMANYR